MLVVWKVNRAIGAAPTEDIDAALARYQAALARDDEVAAATAKEVFDEEASRIERLEDKLSGRRSACELVIPFILTLLGASLRDRHLWACGVGLLALVAASSGYFATSPAESTFRFHTPTTTDVADDLAQANPSRRLAARRLAYIDRNTTRGLALNNWIYAAQVSFVQAVVLLAVALMIFAASTSRPADARDSCVSHQVVQGHQPTPSPCP